MPLHGRLRSGWVLGLVLGAVLSIRRASCDSDGGDGGSSSVVDAVLYRTHMVDGMVLQRLPELVISLHTKPTGADTNGHDGAGGRYKVFMVYDADVLGAPANVSKRLTDGGLPPEEVGLGWYRPR